jgi:hypoxanthine phosphoribosyltransferase
MKLAAGCIMLSQEINHIVRNLIMQNYQEFIEEILFTEEVLQERIKQLGAEISKDFEGEELLLVCILRGGVLFLADLMRQITVPNTIDFMAVTSYGVGARHTTGQARISLDLITNITDRNVLLVEDIVDSGYTIRAVLDLLSARKPKSLKVCVLLNKEERREIPVPIDYCGFTIPDKFIFGYGLDLDEYYRNLPYVAALDQTRFKPGE